MPDFAAKTSVAIATFNGERYLADQLDSILAQTKLPGEIVVSDDRSSDGTVALIEAYRSRSPVPIHLLQQERNCGVFENFRAAFNRCKGEWIFYCDQDDTWEREKVASMLREVSAGVAMVTHQSRICDAALRPVSLVVPGPEVAGRYTRPIVGSRLWAFGHQMMMHRTVWQVAERLIAMQKSAAGAAAPLSFAWNFDRLLLCAAGVVGDAVALALPLTNFRRHPSAVSPAGSITDRKASGWRDAKAKELYATACDAQSLTHMLGALDEPGGGLMPTSPANLAQARTALAAAVTLVKARQLVYIGSSVAGRLRAYADCVERGVYSASRQPGHVPLKFLVMDAIAACAAPSRVAEDLASRA